VAAGIAGLQDLLPPHWEVRVQPELHGEQGDGGDDGFDAVVQVQDSQGTYAQLLVVARQRVSPRDVSGTLAGQARLLRRLNRGFTMVVVAPWLRPRTRALLKAAGIDYLDLTGNVALALQRAAVWFALTGRVPTLHHLLALLACPSRGRSPAGWCACWPTYDRPTPPAPSRHVQEPASPTCLGC